jgi:methyl-accepting chemotaxis protein
MNFITGSIRAKLLATLCIVALIGLGIGTFAVNRMGTLHAASQRITEEALLPSTDAVQVQSNVQSVAAIGGGELSNPKAINVFEPVRQQYLRNVSTYLADLHRDNLTPAQRGLVAKLQVAWDNLYPQIRTWQLWFANQGPKVLPFFNAVNAASGNLVASTQQRDTQIEKSADDAYNSAVTVTWAVILIGFVAALLLGIVLSGRLVRPLRETRRALEEVAEGDLTQVANVTTSDEAGQMAQALNTTIATVHDVVKQLEASSMRLTTFAQKAVAQSTTPDEKVRAASLAEMAEGLDSMINIFKVRPDDQPADGNGAHIDHQVVA